MSKINPKINPKLKFMFAQPEGTVIACQVRKVDPPQFVAETLEDILEGITVRDWAGEQCDNCGCSAYIIERDEVFPEDVLNGWRVRCCGDEHEAARWEREGADPEAVEATRTGCGTCYSLRYLDENQVAF